MLRIVWTWVTDGGGLRQASLRRGFVWSFMGGTVYNLGQWVLLVGLARLSAPDVVGELALAMAISNSVYLLVGLNLRILQATDRMRRWSLSDYLVTRRTLSLSAFVVSLIVGLLFGMRGQALATLVLIALAKSVEALGLTLYGYFQLFERQDLVAGSMILRATLGPALFLAGYYAFDSLPVACGGLLVAWQLTLWIWDRPRAKILEQHDARAHSPGTGGRRRRTVTAMTRKALPLGIDAGLRSLTLNAPRFGVSMYLGSSSLGVFSALASLAMIPSLVTSAMGSAAIPRLARYFASGELSRFRSLFGVMLGVFAVAAAGSILGAHLAGPWIVRTLLGEAYVDDQLLMALVVAYSFAVLQGVIAQALQAANSFHVIAFADAGALAIVALSSALLIPRYGHVGGAASLALGMASSAFVLALAVAKVLRHRQM